MSEHKLAANSPNLIRNGDFSDGEAYWILKSSPPDQVVEIRAGYCFASGGGSLVQGNVKLTRGRYTVSFEGQFIDFESFIRLSAERFGFILESQISPSSDYETEAMTIDLQSMAEGDDFLTLEIVSGGKGGNIRNVQFYRVED